MRKEGYQQKLLAVKYLEYFGNSNPTTTQIMEMESLLFNMWLKNDVIFDAKLTKREQTCLYLAAQGKNISETAAILGITEDTVKAHRREIMNKLSCKNMLHAVSVGIRYGHILSQE